MKKLIIVLITILVFGITIYTLISTKEREVYLSDISPDYYTVGYYDL